MMLHVAWCCMMLHVAWCCMLHVLASGHGSCVQTTLPTDRVGSDLASPVSCFTPASAACLVCTSRIPKSLVRASLLWQSIIMWIYVVHQGGQGFEKFCSLLSRMQHVNALTDFLYQCHKRESLSALKKSHADKVAAAIDDKWQYLHRWRRRLAWGSRFHHVPPCSTMFHHVPPCSTMFHHVPPCSTMFHHVPPCSTMFHHVPPCSTMFHHVPPCSTMFHHVPPCSTMFHHVPPCSTMFHHVPPCSTMFHHLHLTLPCVIFQSLQDFANRVPKSQIYLHHVASWLTEIRCGCQALQMTAV